MCEPREFLAFFRAQYPEVLCRMLIAPVGILQRGVWKVACRYVCTSCLSGPVLSVSDVPRSSCGGFWCVRPSCRLDTVWLSGSIRRLLLRGPRPVCPASWRASELRSHGVAYVLVCLPCQVRGREAGVSHQDGAHHRGAQAGGYGAARACRHVLGRQCWSGGSSAGNANGAALLQFQVDSCSCHRRL